MVKARPWFEPSTNTRRSNATFQRSVLLDFTAVRPSKLVQNSPLHTHMYYFLIAHSYLILCLTVRVWDDQDSIPVKGRIFSSSSPSRNRTSAPPPPSPCPFVQWVPIMWIKQLGTGEMQHWLLRPPGAEVCCWSNTSAHLYDAIMA